MKKWIAVILLTPSLGAAQTAVWLGPNTTDGIGSKLVDQVRITLKKNSALRVVNHEKEAEIELHISTADPFDNTNTANMMTVYSLVWVIPRVVADTPVFLYHSSLVGWCGRDNLPACSRAIATATDETATELREKTKPGRDAVMTR